MIDVMAHSSPDTKKHAAKVAASVVALGGLLAPLLFTAWHLWDWFGISHTGGVWLGLAEWARRGLLLPGPVDGAVFGGSRYMPLPVALNGALGDLLGSTIAAGRVLAVTLTAALLLTLWIGLRRVGLPRWASGLLVALLPATTVVSEGLTSIRFDAAPAALQLSAVLVILRGVTHRRLATAGALCAAAIAFKASSVWGIAALVTFAVTGATSWPERWRRAASVAAGFGSTAVVVAAGSYLVTGCRIVDNLRLTLFSSEDSVVNIAEWVPRLFNDGVSALGVVLVPTVVGAVWLATRRSEADILRSSIAWCLLVTCVVYSDRATYINHLVDLVALGVLAFGAAVAPLLVEREWDGLLHIIVSSTMVVAIVLTNEWYAPLFGVAKGQHTSVLALPSGPALTEDPQVDVANRRAPTVVDAFAFRRMVQVDPTIGQQLASSWSPRSRAASSQRLCY